MTKSVANVLTLYGNAFSPFSRKVQIVLEYKRLPYEFIDGLARQNRDALKTVNKRIEVPAIDDDGLVVVNSADIVAYLDRAFPERPVQPTDNKQWAIARAWERCADTVIDPILVDISYWAWANRPDTMPQGLLEAARSDLGRVYDALDEAIGAGDWVCGDFSIADIALFPHLSSARVLQVPFDSERHPRLMAWYRRCREVKVLSDDLSRTKAYLSDSATMNSIERDKIFWRGDRIEWIVARGYHNWFVKEIEEGRVLWPDLGIPTSVHQQ